MDFVSGYVSFVIKAKEKNELPRPGEEYTLAGNPRVSQVLVFLTTRQDLYLAHSHWTGLGMGQWEW